MDLSQGILNANADTLGVDTCGYTRSRHPGQNGAQIVDAELTRLTRGVRARARAEYTRSSRGICAAHRTAQEASPRQPRGL